MINSLGSISMIQQLIGNQSMLPGIDGDGDHGIEPTPGTNTPSTSFSASVAKAIAQLNGDTSTATPQAYSAVQSFMTQLASSLAQAGGTGNAQASLSGLMSQVANASSPNSPLQQSFQSMLAATGANGSNTLNGFLQSLSSQIQDSNLVSIMG